MLMPFTYVVDSGVIAASGQAVAQLNLQGDQWFHWCDVAASATSDTDTTHMPRGWRVQIQDMSTGRLLSNALVPQRVEAPYWGRRMWRPVFLKPSSTLRFTFEDASAVENRVRYHLQGHKFWTLPQEGQTTSAIVPFIYVVQTAAIAGNGTDVQVLQMESDALYELHSFGVDASDDAATDVMPNSFTVQIRDLNTGNFLSNAVTQERADVPYTNRKLSQPVLFGPSTSLEFSFVNLSGSSQTIRYCLVGAKILV